jgi:hypothetical protein
MNTCDHYFNTLYRAYFIILYSDQQMYNNFTNYHTAADGKDGRCVGLTTLPPSCADCLEIWEPQPPGNLWGCPGLLRDCFTFCVDAVVVLARYVLVLLTAAFEILV